MGKATPLDYYNQEAENYKAMYMPNYEKYPANLIRLKMMTKILKRSKKKTVLDAGCGSATPMIKLIKSGFDVNGFDYSKEMVKYGQNELKSHKLSPNLIYHADLTKFSTMQKKKFDAVIALGVFPHIKNERAALKNIKKCLKKNGSVYIEFRNQLLSLFSQNQFSADFYLNDLINAKKIPKNMTTELIKFYSKKLSVGKNVKTKDGRIVYSDIYAKFRNPFTIEKELFEPIGFKVDNLHFYHYHALPPIFETTHKNIFRKLSKKIENPSDWRGHFMCSAFVVEASVK